MRKPIPIVFAVMAGVFGGFFGFGLGVLAQSGVTNISAVEIACFLFWGVVGGACLGAAFGGFFGFLRIRAWPARWYWICLGGGTAACLTVVYELPNGFLWAGSVLLGLTIGFAVPRLQRFRKRPEK